jgi:uncharacterized protein (DUF934 family)
MNAVIVKPIGQVAQIASDTVTVIRDTDSLPADGDFLISLKRWLAEKEILLPLAQAGCLGVYMLPEDNPEDLQSDLPHLQRIAYEFTVFKYGQGYSDAYLLRKRFGFTGALRAFGDIWRDQLFYLARLGFTEFVIKPGKSVEDALAGFNDFSVLYQDSIDQSQPLFRRRLQYATQQKPNAEAL